MRKSILVFVGVFLISFGAIDWAVGALVPHSRLLIITGAIAVAIAGFLHRWQIQKPQWPLLMTLAIAIFGTVDTCAAGPYDAVLIPPENWPIQKWNPAVFAGAEVWITILIFVVIGLAYLIIYKLFCGRSERLRN